MTRMPDGYWTLERVHDEASKYSSPKDFRTMNASAYQRAWKNGWLGDVCAHMTRHRKPRWTLDSVRQEALKYTKRSVFEQESSAYQAALKNGWVDDVCAHMFESRNPVGYWTIERVREEALKYKTRKEFAVTAKAAYTAAWKNDWLDKVCSHMEHKSQASDRDTIYVWEAVGEFFNGKRVFKIGLTSQRLGDERITLCSTTGGFTPRILTMRCLGRWNVPELERYLLTFGEDPKLVCDGATEFRALTDEELQVILRIVESHPVL